MPTGWSTEALALLAALAADNTREHYTAVRERHDALVLAPARALAAALEPEFGPVRVLRPHRNRRFRPDAPPYRTDTGGIAATPGGAVRSVVLSPDALTVTAGCWAFDAGQLRRYRLAVDTALEVLVEDLDGFALDTDRALRRAPRGFRPDHPQLPLLRLRGLQVARSWEVGEAADALRLVRAAWRAASPLVDWLDEHVGSPDPLPPRPRPAPVNRTSVGPLPVGPLPVDPLPVDPLPVDPLPVDPLPVDPPAAGSPPAPADPVPVDSPR